MTAPAADVPPTATPSSSGARRPKTRTKKPPLYKVILLNDDYTPMEFVVEILKAVFHKQHAEATRIMLHVHQNGMGVAGVYPYEIAETKVRTVEELARQSEYPAQMRDGESLKLTRPTFVIILF